MQVFFCMVDKKKSCPARGRKKKRAGAAETAGCEGWRDSGAAGKNGAGQSSG